MAMKIKKIMGPIIINGQEIVNEIRTELEFDELDEFIAYQEAEMESMELILAFLDDHFEDLAGMAIDYQLPVIVKNDKEESEFTLTPPPFTLEMSEDQDLDEDEYDDDDYYDSYDDDSEDEEECEEPCEITSPMESGLNFNDFIAMFAKMPGVEVAVEKTAEKGLSLTPVASFSLDLPELEDEELAEVPEILGQNGFFDDYYKSR